jgi:TrmH family RNA methyltransferase
MNARPRGPRSPLPVAVPACLERVRVVLVEPQIAGNIGATARAIQTMGIARLVLAAPRADPRSAEARARAHGAEELLDAVAIVPDLDAACAGAHLVVGTTNRRRGRVLVDPTPARLAAARIAETAQSHEVAILFGREDAGLTTRELSRCQVLATIPAARELPSLNLSHAVQVIAYEVFLAAREAVPLPAPDLAEAAELEALYDRVTRLMIAGGFEPHEEDPETFLVSLRRALGRAALEKRDVRTLHRMLGMLEKLPGGEGR